MRARNVEASPTCRLNPEPTDKDIVAAGTREVIAGDHDATLVGARSGDAAAFLFACQHALFYRVYPISHS